MTTTKTTLAAALFTLATIATASAQTAPEATPPAPASAPVLCCQPAQPTPAPVATTPTTVTPTTEPAVAYTEPVEQPLPTSTLGTGDQEDSGWKRPVGRRFMHGFRLGYMHIYHYDRENREGGKSLMSEFKLKSPDMMLLGYEGFYRIVGHSWLNVLLVGNVSVAGLEQSKFIPAASGLIGMEFNRVAQLGVGVNVTPDSQAPTHMIVALGWTPSVGSIQTPIHIFAVPDADGNHRAGATIGMSW